MIVTLICLFANHRDIRLVDEIETLLAKSPLGILGSSGTVRGRQNSGTHGLCKDYGLAW